VFEHVGPRWSHDGKRIAFLRHTTDRKYQLCVASADLRQVTPLLEPELISPDRPLRTSRVGQSAPECLAWSPDDRSIVFPRVEWMTFPDGEKLPGTGLWRFDLVDRVATPLAVHPKEYKGSLYYYRSPAWSRDGKHLAFVGEGMRGETALFVVPSSGRRAEIETPRYDSFQDIGWPAWSPDGKRLAFRQGIQRGYTADPVETIRIIEPGGAYAGRAWATTPERYDALIRAQPLIATAGSQGGSERGAPMVAGITWSPNGSRLVFTIRRVASDPMSSSIWTLDLREPEAQPTCAPGADESATDGYAAPEWLGSGYYGAIQVRDEGQRLAVVSLTPDPNNETTVRHSDDLPTSDLDWSPDRRKVVVAGPDSGSVAGAPTPLTTLRLVDIPIPQGRQ
jgi:Tol biopolymer transport system component